MKYRDLRDFVANLEKSGQLRVVSQPVSPILEMTAFSRLALQNQDGAILFKNAKGYDMPVLTNLFGHEDRIVLAMGLKNAKQLRTLGQALADLKEPQPPKSLSDVMQMRQLIQSAWSMRSKHIKDAPCQEVVLEGKDVDLSRFPIQVCWPEDAGPLITWGAVITKGPYKDRQNLGIYRQQVIAPNKVILRWLPHRGGAQDFKDFCDQKNGKPFPVAVAIGADPATLLASVTPIPDTLSEYQFAGLLRGHRTELVSTINKTLDVPANAEIILEGYIKTDNNHPSGYEHAKEGPFGDHTGYYNEESYFPVLTIERITHRKNPIYLSTYTGRPPDEPAILALALNEVFVPFIQKQFPEITDFYLPMEACSYRLAVVQLRKSYAGQARRIMMGVWSFLRQFLYTKWIVVVDEDINIRSWEDVMWAISTRVDPKRDTVCIDNTPIDYLDFASPVAGLGSKMGIDATRKDKTESSRNWPKSLVMNENVEKRMQQLYESLNISTT